MKVLKILEEYKPKELKKEPVKEKYYYFILGLIYI